jgi:hypothetical protein
VKFTRLFYLISAMSLLIGVVVMFAVNLPLGALVIAIDLVSLGTVYVLFFKTIIRNERLAVVGKPARARIVSVRNTGITVNDDLRQVDFTLEVYPEDGEPYEAKTRALVHFERLPSLKPGSFIPVLIDPANPLEVAVVDLDEEEDGAPAATPPHE